MHKVYIVDYLRTPVVKMGGNLASFKEQDLAAAVLKALPLEETSEKIDEVIMGVSRQTSIPSNAARYAALEAGLDDTIPAYTVQRMSASGLQAIASAYAKLASGSMKQIVAGGMESASNMPVEILDARYKFDETTTYVYHPVEAQVQGAQPEDKYGKLTYEAINQKIASEFGVTPEEEQAYCTNSAAKFAASELAPKLVSFEVRQKKTMITVDRDEPAGQPGASARPADAAGAMILVSDASAAEVTPQAEILAIVTEAGDPTGAGFIADRSLAKVLAKAAISWSDLDQIEVFELTPAQAVATVKALQKQAGDVDVTAKVNPYGGALAYGNAFGAAGAVELQTLVEGLKKTSGVYGLLVCPLEGGQVMSLVVKNL